MRWPSTPFGNTAARISLAATGPAGFTAALAILHNPVVAAIAAAIAVIPTVADAVAKIVDSRNRNRPAIISAKAARDTARSEAAALAKRAETQAEIARAGLEPSTATEARKIQILQSITADLPKDRRLNDQDLTQLLLNGLTQVLTDGSPKPSSPSNDPDNNPDGTVIPLRKRS